MRKERGKKQILAILELGGGVLVESVKEDEESSN